MNNAKSDMRGSGNISHDAGMKNRSSPNEKMRDSKTERGSPNKLEGRSAYGEANVRGAPHNHPQR
ncbi:MAG: hypothetical protein JSS87_10700 [Acidobacteria bacterium]|nr:hypothetical protein [Acidobacteriota bacterium]